MNETTSCTRLPEEEVAMALSLDHGLSEEVRDAIPCWMSRCCEACSGKLHRVLRIRELMELAGVTDVYDAWRSVDAASRAGGEPATEEERLASAVALLMAEERLRFESPAEGLDATRRAWELVVGLEGPDALRCLADAESGRLRGVSARRPGMLALVQARYGNSLRYCSQLADGLMWTARAVMLVRSCEVAPFVRAEVHSLAATTHLHSGNLRHALMAAREAIASYESFDRHRAGVDKIHLGEILFQSGEPVSDVLEVLEEAASEIDSLRAPIFDYACRLNVAAYSISVNRVEAAEAVLRELPPTDAAKVDLKRRGLDGLVQIVKGDYETAISRLRNVIQGFAELGMAHDGAILTLYLGEALIRQGDCELGRREIERAHKLFCDMEAGEQIRQAFAQLVRLAHRATAAEMIAGIRRQAELMGGCLPLI
ncbi:MAG TPA: hypothetical protein VGG06_02165 [Thermoanaerobaculia bacterium]